MTKTNVQKLEQALRDGFSVAMACHVSGISRSTYYDHLNRSQDFSDKMELAKSWATERAKQVVIQEINKGNFKAAQWWLEHKARDEFGTNSTLDNRRPDLFQRYDRDKLIPLMADTMVALAEA